jgi:Heterokaryon incompatibility protein (HET)
MRKLSGTKHKYGSGFPHFKRLQLDEYSNIDNKELESIAEDTAPFAKTSNPFETMSNDERATVIMQSLLDCVGARLFVSDFFFMLESDGGVDMIPPKWASHFDKMKGIIREPGRLIVQIPPKNTSLSVPTWYKSINPYLRFIDAVYVCRRSSLRLSQEIFADVLGGLEQKIAVDLHAILIAGLSILSIAGGDGLVEKLVMAIRGDKLDPTQNALQANDVLTDWQIRKRRRCPCSKDSIHRPLSPIAAAKAVGIDIWRERHKHNVNRVWDLQQDVLVDDIDVRKVVFITHRWKKPEISYQDVMERKRLNEHAISGMSIKLYRIREALRRHTQYAWMDTICIDKSNLSELDEAIRSMYKWYASCAAVVLDSGTSLDEWHNRGWCLQEGAAAGVLYGISNDGNLATIEELANKQHQAICTLDLHLYYHPGNAVEILARMDVRKTTRKEDMAYALAGIFSIDLTLAYGEGLRSRARLLQQLAIQKGDLSFLSFHTAQLTPHSYLPAIDQLYYLIAKCIRASAPVTVSHFGMCFEVQLVEGEDARQVLEKLNRWIKMSFAKGRFLGAEDLIKAGEQPEYRRSSSVELAIVHDIRSLILVQVYGQDMQTGGETPIKLCYRLQCCQIEELEFKRIFQKVDIELKRIWLGDKPESDELD